MVVPGIYKHYKGNIYQVVGFGLHSETNEELVLYKRADSPGWSQVWARPKTLFEQPTAKGVARFTLIQAEGSCSRGCGRTGLLTDGVCGVCQLIDEQKRGGRPLETGE